MPKPNLEIEPRYEMIIYWSVKDGAFIVEVPELPGCAADGRTYGEAVANAETIIREWLETALELGRQIPEPRGRLNRTLAPAHGGEGRGEGALPVASELTDR